MPLRADLLNPIAGDNPSGANLRYDPVYDQIKEARRQDDAGPQGDWQHERKAADYRLVVDLAGKAIAERSKDLQLATWLTEAALHREKFSGLQQGLELLRGLLEQYWDSLYPEIEDDDLEARSMLLGWLAEERMLLAIRVSTPITAGGLSFFDYQESRRIGSEEDAKTDAQKAARAAAIALGKPTAEDFDKDAASTPTAQYEAWVAALDGCLAAIASLGSLCDEKFGPDAPSFHPLRTALEEVRRTASQILQKRPGHAPPPPLSQVAPGPEPYYPPDQEVAAAVAPPPARIATIGLDPENVDEVGPRLQAVARYLRAQDAYSPAPYLLLRGYRWGELRGYGDPPDPSMLVPPPTDVRQTIRRLAAEYNWSELIQAAETAMSQPYGRAWLDLQRHVVNATEQSGYAHVAAAIRSEVRALLVDLPRLPQWEFSDETPVANAETLAWLKQLEAPAPPELPPSVFEEPAPSPIAAPDTFTLAVEAARSGRASEAIQMLADEIPRQQSGRARFQRKLQLAQVCMMTGHETLALPLLEELAQSIDLHQLDAWESREIVAQPLVMLYKLARDESAKQKLYARISRLDPLQALECAR
ncbi:MAG TPA: type VI secretion system protein TssA [Bryobacteraceae bacterium]|nr:type VI secretion system protein TssA [Bryobacteraceae bacterium]